MLRYLMVAGGLKLSSTCPQMKSFYRVLGNIFGGRRRVKEGLPMSYVERAVELVELFRKHVSLERDRGRFLELGTGWVHWGALVVRLFYDAEITLFDVWDNRQLEALKRYFTGLDELIRQSKGGGERFFTFLSKEEYERGHKLLKSISGVNSFDELYDMVNFQYVIEESGRVCCFQDEWFDVIFSCNVLEHVNRVVLNEYIRDIYRLLRAGGYSIHTIDIGDHLSYYDPSVSVKNYLRYSDKVWGRWFENEVQYFNRVQRSDWLKMFKDAGLELVKEESIYGGRGEQGVLPNKIDSEYKHRDRRELECLSLRIVHRKPVKS